MTAILLSILSSGLITGLGGSYLTYLNVKNNLKKELQAQKDKFEGEIKVLEAEHSAKIQVDEKQFQSEMVKLIVESIVNSMPNTKKALDDQLASKLRSNEIDIVRIINSN